MKPFAWRVRVYWEDTDARGSVHPVRWLYFFERARTEWLRALGVQQQALRAQTGGVFVLRRAQLDFGRAAARLDDEILIHTGLQRLGRATLLLRQQGRFFDSANARNEGDFLCSARIDLAWVHAATLRPARMEPTLQGILQQLHA